ncbi:caldesmon-like isoform X1 [Chenopodium quinoa]|uniref:caldesmon-like isoform X1 n=1 Tax=Chenopodium quinoa TaxID=63459 RepID=UPI000B78F14A|nr:caldesmon-like isoform X1 [Chenopodium quinoa]
MEYERIERPQKGGGLSPAKLRSMLLGVEKKRRELLGEVDSSCSLRSQHSGVDDPGTDYSESYKDVDVVREFVECSTSTTGDSEMIPDRKLKDQNFVSSRIGLNEEFEEDYENGHDNLGVVSSAFEFQKTERGQPRVPAAPFSKPPPSKWDDAQKWIASPTSNRPKTGQSHGVQGARKTNIFGHGGRKTATKVVHEVPDEKLVAFEEPDMKRMDSNLAKKANATQKLVNWGSEPYSHADLHGKAADMIENSIGDPEIHLSQHDSSISIQTSTAMIPQSFARSVSMRDMGTEMTPIASQEPSRTGTPVKVKSPMHSPTSSRSSTPKRANLSAAQTSMINGSLNQQRKELSEKEMQMKTRKEIMELGMQLGKVNIAAWAGKDDEETSSSANTMAGGQASKSVVEARAEAWEEAEKAKYTARLFRFEREEMKIQAWENHQKAKTEAEMRKNEVEVERMKAKAQDKFMNKLATARHKAEEKRAAAEMKMNKQATKAEQQAEYIRQTGRIPSKFSSWSCCC